MIRLVVPIMLILHILNHLLLDQVWVLLTVHHLLLELLLLHLKCGIHLSLGLSLLGNCFLASLLFLILLGLIHLHLLLLLAHKHSLILLLLLHLGLLLLHGKHASLHKLLLLRGHLGHPLLVLDELLLLLLLELSLLHLESHLLLLLL